MSRRPALFPLHWLLVLLSVFALGCGGFPASDDDLTSDPGDANRVTMGGVVFDNRSSDQLTGLAWFGIRPGPVTIRQAEVQGITYSAWISLTSSLA